MKCKDKEIQNSIAIHIVGIRFINGVWEMLKRSKSYLNKECKSVLMNFVELLAISRNKK